MKQRIHIHKNIHEQSENRYLIESQKNPIDRLRETIQLIIRINSLSPKKTNTNRIYFTER